MGKTPKPRKVRTPREPYGFERLQVFGIEDWGAFALKADGRSPVGELIWGRVGIFSPAAEYAQGDIACVVMKTGARYVGRVFLSDNGYVCIVGDRPHWHVRTVKEEDVKEVAALVEVRTPIPHGPEPEPSGEGSVSRAAAMRAAWAGYNIFAETGKDIVDVPPEKMLRRRQTRPLFRTAHDDNQAGEN